MKTVFVASALGAALLLTAPATAQQATANAQAEALGQCFVLKTTGADRLALAKWLVTAMASIPQLKDMAAIDPVKKDAADREMAGIFTRLITVDCLNEAKPLAKSANKAAFEVAGETLGRIAIQEVLGNRQAEEAMGGYAKYIDVSAFEKLMK